MRRAMAIGILATGILAIGVAGGVYAWARDAAPFASTRLADGLPGEAVAATSATVAASQVPPATTPGTPGGTGRGLAFVINSAQASIDLIDVGSRRLVRRVPVLREPHHMALTPDHRFLLVGDTGGNEMLFLDPVTGAVTRRLPVSDPYQFGFSPDGKWLVVDGLLRNQVDLYDAATMRLAHRVKLASMPSHENFSPNSSVVYVSLQGTDSLAAIEVATGRVLWQSVVGPAPAGVLWHDGRLLVGVMGADYVAVVDPANGAVLRRVTTARGAHVLFVPPDQRAIYATNRIDGVVVVLDPATLAELRRFRIPGGPDDMDFAPDGRIWVTQRFARSLAVVDPRTGSYQTVPTGRSPHGIWLNTHDAFPASPMTVSAR